jgi:hypothetical protein
VSFYFFLLGQRLLRCYLLDIDRITAMHVVEANDYAAAALEADKILATSPYTAAELGSRATGFHRQQ